MTRTPDDGSIALNLLLRPMRIHVDDPSLADDLALYLRRCDFLVRELGRGLVEVAPIRWVTEPGNLRIEVDAFLRVWCAMHGGASAAVVDG